MEGAKFFYEWDGEDVLFLGGDIHTKNRHHELLAQIPPHVKVFMVAGNHEYYHNDFAQVKEYLKGLEKDFHNFRFLDNEAIQLGDYTLFGGTMFTKFTLRGEQDGWFARHAAKDMIGDFYRIRKDNKTWTTADHEEEYHIFMLAFIEWTMKTMDQKRLVLTHFMPTEKCCDIRFAGSQLNPYFAENMEKYFGLIHTWFCGHGHDTFDKTINDTRILMNPRGYGEENKYGFNPNLVVNI